MTPTPSSGPAELPELFTHRPPPTRPQARGLAGPTRPGQAPPGKHGPTRTAATSAGPGSAATTVPHVPAPAPTAPTAGLADGAELDPGRPVDTSVLPTADWSLVRRLRVEVSERLKDVTLGTALDQDIHGERARRHIDEAIRAESNDRMATRGQPPLSVDEQLVLARAVQDGLFGLGRIEPLRRLQGLDNIEIRGHDQVTLEFGDGRIVYAPPIADNDEDLAAEIAMFAAHGGQGERAFSPANPKIEMALNDGSRMAATYWGITPRPYMTIRLHRFVDVDLNDLIALNSLDEYAAAFLSAAVAAGKSIVVSGPPAAGKTTFMRGVLNELPPDIAIGTIESSFELQLHKMPERHRRVWAAQAKPGGGERDASGRAIGAITTSDLLKAALWHNIDRIVVGETRGGEELLSMFEALEVSQGSITSVHATGVKQTAERLVTLAMNAGREISAEYAYRQVGLHTDLIVVLDVIDERHLPGGRKHRFLKAISAVGLGEEDKTGLAYTPLWTAGPDRRATPTGEVPEWLQDLTDLDFDPTGMQTRQTRYAAPLHTLRATR